LDRDPVILGTGLGKCYPIYQAPVDRLKQSFWRRRKVFYREFWALRDVSLGIRKGETVGLIGSNGSGKSTLLQLVAGVLRPTEGDLRIRGRVSALLELGAGFNPDCTGRENVFMNGAIMGIPQREIEKRYDDILRFADIGPFIDQPVKTYSSGMYVRLAFAVAVHVSPDILLVDEALAVGDLRFQQKCIARIREFCEKGTVLFVSHDPSVIRELCSRVVWLEGGRIRGDGHPREVVDRYLEYMYEGEKEPAGARPPDAAGPGKESPEDLLRGFLPVDSACRQFGDRRAVIEAIRVRSRNGTSGVVYSGDPCEISLYCRAFENVNRPVAGFVIRDRLGRELLADNTALLKKDLPPFSKGGGYILTFHLDSWPNLREEEYSLTAAVADGSLTDHVQCHYVHDALVIRSVPVRMPGAILSVTKTEISLGEVEGAHASQFL
jgi:lipopolysaccharide transport system ATP-binding protein